MKRRAKPWASSAAVASRTSSSGATRRRSSSPPTTRSGRVPPCGKRPATPPSPFGSHPARPFSDFAGYIFERPEEEGTMRVLAINAAVCAVAAAIILGGAELWLRLTVPSSSEESIFEYTQETPRYKLMKRNARFVVWGKEFRTNDLGFRDDAATVPAKQPGEFRIIVLGD